MVRRISRWGLLIVQIALLNASYFLSRSWTRGKRTHWVVGVQEIAAMLSSIAAVIPNSISVCLQSNNSYEAQYSFHFDRRVPRVFEALLGAIVGPVLLGLVANKASGVLYVGSSGFLRGAPDYRNYEFSWLKARAIPIVCYFTGTDIRSPLMMKSFEERTGLKTLGGRIYDVRPETRSAQYEQSKRRLAEVSEKYASLVFNARVDQMSYLESRTEAFMYFYPDEEFRFNTEKFDSTEPWRVVHAPSNPYLKGTELVREAVAQLRKEGLSFEYIELQGVSNSQVLAELQHAQIVLNEFFAFVPGLFGVEALANTCALLTSADEEVEPDLPSGSNSAWVRTRHTEIADNLRFILNNHDVAKNQAIRGYKWAKETASASKSGSRLRRKIRGIECKGN